MPIAFSYARFSSSAQEDGHSLQRQIDAAKNFVLRHPEYELVLDTTLNLVDAGISAFRGDNTHPDAALGRFISAVNQGIVEEGSWLLIESWDRFSRQRVNKVAGLLLSLINQGIVIATLHNGNVYREADFDEGTTGLVQLLGALIAMQGHHQEQVEKGKRVRAAWGNKYERVALGEKLTKLTPFWLALEPDRRNFRLIPEQVEIVKRIFALRLKGHGAFYIASRLNEDGISPIRGRSWGATTIKRILSSPNVIGTFTNAHGESFPDYYPAIICLDDFSLVQAISETPTSQGGQKNSAHELINLIKHQCGSTMRRFNKGAGYIRLKCPTCKIGLKMEDATDAMVVAISNLSYCSVPTDWGREIGDLQVRIEFQLTTSAEEAYQLYKQTRTRRAQIDYLQADKALKDAKAELSKLLQGNRTLLLRMEENAIKNSPNLLQAARKVLKRATYDSGRHSLSVESITGRTASVSLDSPGEEFN